MKISENVQEHFSILFRACVNCAPEFRIQRKRFIQISILFRACVNCAPESRIQRKRCIQISENGGNLSVPGKFYLNLIKFLTLCFKLLFFNILCQNSLLIYGYFVWNLYKFIIWLNREMSAFTNFLILLRKQYSRTKLFSLFNLTSSNKMYIIV